MGANFFFDKMLPSIKQEANGELDPKRQVEVFSYGGDLWLRIGTTNQENSGTGRYTVKLSTTDAKELLAAIEDGMVYFGAK